MNATRRAAAAGLCGLLLTQLPAAPVRGRQEDRAREIVERIDELYRADSSRALVEMEIVTPHWTRTLRMRIWTQGDDKTFIRILEPEKERGVATLRLGTEMWNYLPPTNKVIKVPPSMMMSSWMGSDFTNDDLVDQYTFLESYTFEMTEVENPEPGALYVRAEPKPGLPIIWGHIVLAVRADDLLPDWEKYYDERGRLVREMRFRDVKTFDGRRIPSEMELDPATKEGRTVLRYLEAEFDIPIDDDIFTLRHLRERI